MKKLIHTLTLLLLFSAIGPTSVKARTLTEFLEVFEKEKEKIDLEHQIRLDEALTVYLRGLSEAEAGLKEAGNVDGVIAVKEEKTRLAAEKNIPDTPPDSLPDPVKALQAEFHVKATKSLKTADKKMYGLTSKYMKPLNTLKVTLLQADQIGQAQLVDEEIKRVEEVRDAIKSRVQKAMKSTARPRAIPKAPYGTTSSFKPLFNGRDLEGWQTSGNGKWDVRQGVLTCNGERMGWLYYTGKTWKNFHLKLDYKISRKANSGVFFHVARVSDPVNSGAEIQIMDDQHKEPTPRSTGSLYNLIAPNENANKAPGAWNHMEIIFNNGTLHVNLNGRRIIDSSTVNGPEQPGHIGLQSHTSEVEFRNILIMEL